MQPTSTRNPHWQAIRKAVGAGRPMDDGRIVIEGPHLVQEALRGRWRLDQILITPNGRERHADLLGQTKLEAVEVTARAFEAMTGTETTQEIMALVTPRVASWEDLFRHKGIVVALDGIQDPGNAGAIVRSAEAFGAAGVVFLPDCVRVANGKFLRATSGSLFRLPYLEAVRRSDFVAQLERAQCKLFALMAEGGKQLGEVDFRGPCALAVGSEAHGVSADLRAAAESVAIATRKVESLNAAVAASIALYEVRRQRSGAEGR